MMRLRSFTAGVIGALPDAMAHHRAFAVERRRRQKPHNPAAIGEGHDRFLALAVDMRRSRGIESETPHRFVGFSFRLRERTDFQKFQRAALTVAPLQPLVVIHASGLDPVRHMAHARLKRSIRNEPMKLNAGRELLAQPARRIGL